jgi:hypothetical protein
MSEEVKSKEQSTEEKVDKKTNKQFSQSEHDKAVKEAVAKEQEKYKDFDTMKTTLESLLTEKKERELSEMSDLEKAQAEKSDVQKSLKNWQMKTQSLSKQF